MLPPQFQLRPGLCSGSYRNISQLLFYEYFNKQKFFSNPTSDQTCSKTFKNSSASVINVISFLNWRYIVLHCYVRTFEINKDDTFKRYCVNENRKYLTARLKCTSEQSLYRRLFARSYRKQVKYKYIHIYTRLLQLCVGFFVVYL